MRIAYVTCVYPPYPGGIGMAAQGMAREMTKRGHPVEVFTPRQKSEVRSQKSEVRVRCLYPWLRFGNAAFVPQLLWRLRNFEIVHLLYPFYGAAELVPLLRRVSRAKIVVHHLMDAVSPGWLGAFFNWHTQHLAPRIFRAADMVCVLSEDYYRNSEGGKLGWKKVEIVPHGVDTQQFQPLTPKLPITNYQLPIILFVGGLDRAHYFKGVPVLLEACRLLKNRGVKFVCQIIGDGELRLEYEAQAEGSEAEFVGFVPHDQLPVYYQRAAVCVVPATERVECFSMVAAEAQACGIPVIVTDFPGVRVTIKPGATGLVARPNDAHDLADQLRTLLQDRQRAYAMGQAGRARVERLYSWKVVGDKLEKVYRCLTECT